MSEEIYLNHNIKKGIFISPLCANWKEYLLGKIKEPKFYDINMSAVIEYWKKRWLEMRIKNDLIISEVENFNKNSVRISNLLQMETQTLKYL